MFVRLTGSGRWKRIQSSQGRIELSRWLHEKSCHIGGWPGGKIVNVCGDPSAVSKRHLGTFDRWRFRRGGAATTAVSTSATLPNGVAAMTCPLERLKTGVVPLERLEVDVDPDRDGTVWSLMMAPVLSFATLGACGQRCRLSHRSVIGTIQETHLRPNSCV